MLSLMHKSESPQRVAQWVRLLSEVVASIPGATGLDFFTGRSWTSLTVKVATDEQLDRLCSDLGGNRSTTSGTPGRWGRAEIVNTHVLQVLILGPAQRPGPRA
jgi:hypothetical protein